MRAQDFTGKIFGKLTVISLSKRQSGSKRFWNCKCECGKTSEVVSGNLKTGKTQSCGCSHNRKNITSARWTGYKKIPGSYLCKIKAGAKQRNLNFDVSINYLWNLFVTQSECCAYSAMSLTFGDENNAQTASLDRINSKIGYIEGNLQWVHKDINLMKNKFSDDYFLELCRKIIKHKK